MIWQAFYEEFIIEKGYLSVLDGIKITLITAICALIIGVVIGTIIAFVQIIKSNNIGIRALKAVFNVYVAFFRGTPIVVQLLFIYFVVFPLMGLGTMMPEIVGIIIFGLNSGAYVSEIMRGGILSVDVGQTEAGRALGLSAVMTMVRIVFPQAIKNVIPTIANEFVSLLKETSVLSFIGVVDLTQAFKEIAGANYEYTVPYLVLALSYLVLVLIATGLVKILERRLRASDKR